MSKHMAPARARKNAAATQKRIVSTGPAETTPPAPTTNTRGTAGGNILPARPLLPPKPPPAPLPPEKLNPSVRRRPGLLKPSCSSSPGSCNRRPTSQSRYKKYHGTRNRPENPRLLPVSLTAVLHCPPLETLPPQSATLLRVRMGFYPPRTAMPRKRAWVPPHLRPRPHARTTQRKPSAPNHQRISPTLSFCGK